MTFSHLGSINPNRAGSPNGSRPENDDDDLLKNWRTTAYRGTAPWVGNEPAECPNCVRVVSTKKGCAEHSLGMPRVVVPGAPGPDDVLPCVGKWKLYDTEVVNKEHELLCGGCPFRDWCRETATANNYELIWSATSWEERRTATRKEAA